MKRILPLFFAVCLLLGFFYWGLQSGVSQPKPGTVMAKKGIQVMMAEDSATAVAAGFTPNFQNTIQRCFGIETQSELDSYMVGLIGTDSVDLQLQYENVHLRNPQGDEIRIQALGNEGETRYENIGEVRIFTVDSEALPLCQPLPPRLVNEDPERQWSLAMNLGTEFFRQRKETHRLRNGDSLSVEWVQGTIKEFQWSKDSSTLACSQNICDCLH